MLILTVALVYMAGLRQAPLQRPDQGDEEEHAADWRRRWASHHGETSPHPASRGSGVEIGDVEADYFSRFVFVFFALRAKKRKQLNGKYLAAAG